MTDPDDLLRRHAPAADDDLRRMEAAAWDEARLADLVDLCGLMARVCAVQHGLDPLPAPPEAAGSRWRDADPLDWPTIGNLDRRDRVALAFATQFSVDVSCVTSVQRSELFFHLGASALNFAGALFVFDFLPRVRAALGALCEADRKSQSAPSRSVPSRSAPTPGAEAVPVPTSGPSGVWDALDSFTRTVPGLTSLDPVTTELVRLRGARQHQCRLCSSLRSRPALLAGADDGTFSAVDHYAHSALAPERKAALAFTDAMVWTPGHIAPADAAAVASSFSPPQQVELVLDIARNALNKVAVALAADAPHVDEGTEIFDVDTDGALLYGLSLD